MQGGFSRIPVYEESIDNIIGVLYTKDMLRQLRDQHDRLPIRDLVRAAYFVPETKKLDDLLREIRQKRVHMVIVVDEYGSVAGLVTIEDLVEEIVGDIQDEYDREELLYEQINENEYVFDAKISIDEFNELMDADLGDEDYDTLGGFLYAQLDKIPNVGDTSAYKDLTFTVLSTRGRRITKVRVERKHAQTPQTSIGEQQDEPNIPLSGPRLLPSPPRRNEDTQQEQTNEPAGQTTHSEARGA
jgi:CBS domain containing-hemolysin-like protein